MCGIRIEPRVGKVGYFHSTPVRRRGSSVFGVLPDDFAPRDVAGVQPSQERRIEGCSRMNDLVQMGRKKPSATKFASTL